MKRHRRLWGALLGTLIALGCGSSGGDTGGSDGGASDAGVGTDGTAPADGGGSVGVDASSSTDAGSIATDSGATDSGPTDAGPAEAGAGKCEGGAVCPPTLESVVKLAAPNPGLRITWSLALAQPCDSVEVERHDFIVPYPSEEMPVQPPNFTVPSPGLTVDDPGASAGTFYTYHARCVASGTRSAWSNELAAAGNSGG